MVVGNGGGSCFVFLFSVLVFVCLRDCGEISWWSVVMVMVVVAPVLCVSADVFMTCAKRRQPSKTRVSALAR